ncbi:hypothetical protein [Stieleria varia]|uniref:Uncharacterized protein n=1 Tax=Stieleria varia TaxID=2528005 RepID=A0A5C6AHD4_9BACT|nr:hypothetical protein [Stieleria varia]TWT98481.1 hypothetical protein Pla52n_49950 [Stieleria varia]
MTNNTVADIPPKSTTRLTILAIVAVLVILGAVVAWVLLKPIDHLASGKKDDTIIIDCDFDKFRQIMVRKNATAAILGQSGMRLISDRLQDVQVDLSKDDRPILNAIRGRSKSDVNAIKHLTVSLNDPTLHADELQLRQVAEIEPGLMYVRTSSLREAGRLLNYETTLTAKPSGEKTEVQLSVELTVNTSVPKLFVSHAEREVQRAADDAVAGQAKSIRDFVTQYADQRLILPEFRGVK